MIGFCGYCGGKGWILGRAYDREGRAQTPPRMCCGECGGEGVCERGGELSPAPAPSVGPQHTADLARAGSPAWA